MLVFEVFASASLALSADRRPFIVVYLPAGFILVRIAVLIYLTRMTFVLVIMLKSAVVTHKAPVQASLAQRRLLGHLMRWITVAIMSSLTTIVLLAFIAAGGIVWLESPTHFLLLLAISVASRIGASLASIQFCKPPQSPGQTARVAAARCTTVPASSALPMPTQPL